MYKAWILSILLLTLLSLAVLLLPDVALASGHCDAFLDGCMGAAETVIEQSDCFNGYLECIGYEPPL